MSLTLVAGVVTEVTPAVAKEFEFLRSECERLMRERSAMLKFINEYVTHWDYDREDSTSLRKTGKEETCHTELNT